MWFVEIVGWEILFRKRGSHGLIFTFSNFIHFCSGFDLFFFSFDDMYNFHKQVMQHQRMSKGTFSWKPTMIAHLDWMLQKLPVPARNHRCSHLLSELHYGPIVIVLCGDANNFDMNTTVALNAKHNVIFPINLQSQ